MHKITSSLSPPPTVCTQVWWSLFYSEAFRPVCGWSKYKPLGFNGGFSFSFFPLSQKIINKSGLRHAEKCRKSEVSSRNWGNVLTPQWEHRASASWWWWWWSSSDFYHRGLWDWLISSCLSHRVCLNKKTFCKGNRCQLLYIISITSTLPCLPIKMEIASLLIILIILVFFYNAEPRKHFDI